MVLARKIVEGDLRVVNGIINTIAEGGGLEPKSEEIVIDGTGLHLLPGAIDPHVHFREPGDLKNEDLESGSRAAAAGGVTSFLDMPNNTPNATNRSILQTKIISSIKKIGHSSWFLYRSHQR